MRQTPRCLAATRERSTSSSSGLASSVRFPAQRGSDPTTLELWAAASCIAPPTPYMHVIRAHAALHKSYHTINPGQCTGGYQSKRLTPAHTCRTVTSDNKAHGRGSSPTPCMHVNPHTLPCTRTYLHAPAGRSHPTTSPHTAGGPPGGPQTQQLAVMRPGCSCHSCTRASVMQK